ncbi:PDZ domain containing protein [Nitzschia inconspicua]|uniref:PDZ domain containing protein n=1 Tax=Nitzschia inconspicua TaxID=303405 RepID=A0A9K3LH42_9STRA|nr:PDZ domain containing protein [Nitzschia inconspicua]
MKVLSPFRFAGSSSIERGRPNSHPKMRDFGKSSNRSAVALHSRGRSNNRSNLHDADDTSPSEHYSTETFTPSSQYKVSEMVNPDGTVTVRNLVITVDGSWKCLQEERDYHQSSEGPSSRRSAASQSYSTFLPQINSASHSLSYSTLKSEIDLPSNRHSSDMVPELTPVASFDTSRSSRSSETSKAGKSRSDVSELSEAGAHELRRQRLAKSMNFAQKFGVQASPPLQTYTTKDDHLQQSPSSPRSLDSSQSSQIMLLMRSPVGTRTPTTPATQRQDLESPPRSLRPAAFVSHKNRKTGNSSKSKHVVFLDYESDSSDENISPAKGKSASDDESSVFRNVVTPSPEGSGKIDEILGPPPHPTFLLPNGDGADDGASKNSNRSAKSNGSGTMQRDVETPRIPIEIPPAQMSAAKYLSDEVQDADEEKTDTPFIHTVTVHKGSKGDKIGIFVGLKRFSYGKRLVVSRVAPDGKFANSGVDVGDIVVSINGKSMLERPSSQEAFDIVVAAPDRVTFVVQKQGDIEDARSISGSTISSISKDWGYASTPERRGSTMKSISKSVHEVREVENNFEQKMSPDGSMIVSKETEIWEPVPAKANESWKLSGALAVAVKKVSPSQSPGIKIGTREASIGRVLYVSEIHPSSPFVHTPLRVGDILLSINDVDLERNADVVGAYSALGKSTNEISIVARKAAESLNDFLQNRKELARLYSSKHAVGAKKNLENAGTEAVERSVSTEKNRELVQVKSAKAENSPTNHDRKSPNSVPQLFEFDEEAYGASLHGYNSSKYIRITKSHPQEEVGIHLMPVVTEWGNLLTVSKIMPRTIAARANISVGDAILAINGVDFRENADAKTAFAVMKRAMSDIRMELQPLSLFPTEISSKESKLKDNITVLEADSVGVVRTRTFDSNDDFISQTGTLKISGKLEAVPVGEEKWNAGTVRKTPVRNGLPESQDEDEAIIPSPTPKNHRKVWVTVKKSHPSEKVGISFAALERRLIVTNICPSGLLRGTPVLPGDTILSINGVDFSLDPDVKYASELVATATEDVLLEILKTGYAVDVDNNNSKSCFRRKFGCGQHKRQEYAVRLVRHSKEDDGETYDSSLADTIQF